MSIRLFNRLIESLNKDRPNETHSKSGSIRREDLL